ncbi:MAG: hypothetical protein WDO13_10250 [Verrucomicrobiota bacterium]
MNRTADSVLPPYGPSYAARVYRAITDTPLAFWAALAALRFAAQIVFRRDLAPGEFGTFNTILGITDLMALPLFALHEAFTLYFRRVHPAASAARLETLRASSLTVMETFAWGWGLLSLALVLFLSAVVELPRFSLQLFTLLCVLMALGGEFSRALCRSDDSMHHWVRLVLAFAVVRVLAAALITAHSPWAETALGVFILAGFITLVPALRSREVSTADRLKALRCLADRDFLLFAGATLSTLLAIFLFGSADRIVAQAGFGAATDNNLGLVNWPQFDAYQTAGLLGRGLLWGTQPLLWMFYARRSPLERTTWESLRFLGIHLTYLLVGALMLGMLARPLSRLFCGADYAETAALVPSFATVMVLIGVLQAVAAFCLASRRYAECFLLAACSIAYAVVLYVGGRQPHLMIAYMFGGALISLMIVLFLAIVRWGRRQP